MSSYLLVCVALVALVAAAVSLTAIWAATSKRHWFWRALVLWGCGAAMLPIEAFEPAFVLLCGMSASCLLLMALRRLQKNARGQAEPAVKPLAQFQLADVILVTTLVGLVLSTTILFMKQPAEKIFEEGAKPLTYPVLAFAILTVLCWTTVHGPLANLAACGLVASLVWLTWLLWPVVGWLYKLDSDLGGFFGWQFDSGNIEGYAATFLGFVLFAAFVTTSLSLRGLGQRQDAAGRWSRNVARLGGCVGLTLLAALYIAMLGRTPFPPTVSTPENHYERIVGIAQRVSRLNDSKLPLAEWRKTDRAKAEELSTLYDELVTLAAKPNRLPYDYMKAEDRKKRDKTMMDQISAFRTLCESLEAEAKSSIDHGDLDRAIELAFVNVRVGTMLSQNGVGIDALMGSVFMNRGKQPLSYLRPMATDTQCEQVIESLFAAEKMVEPFDTWLQREIAYCQRMYGWQMRFGHLMNWLTIGPSREWESYKYFPIARNRQIAINRLLMTEFAIRRYQLAHEALPAQLDQIERYLPEPPIDPFSARPFIYRTHDDGFLLYSVGPDRVDDGGLFESLLRSLDKPEVDLDARTLIRDLPLYAQP